MAWKIMQSCQINILSATCEFKVTKVFSVAHMFQVRVVVTFKIWLFWWTIWQFFSKRTKDKGTRIYCHKVPQLKGAGGNTNKFTANSDKTKIATCSRFNIFDWINANIKVINIWKLYNEKAHSSICDQISGSQRNEKRYLYYTESCSGNDDGTYLFFCDSS